MDFDQNALRKALYGIMKKERFGSIELSDAIGVSPYTLRNFIQCKKEIRFTTFCKIEAFIEDYNKLTEHKGTNDRTEEASA